MWGDRIQIFDVSDSTRWNQTTRLVTGVVTSTGVVTLDAASAGSAIDTADLVAINSRGGFTSLDDIVMHDGVTVGGVAVAQDVGYPGGVRPYDLTAGGRTAGGWNAAAHVVSNAGVNDDLSLSDIDVCIEKIRDNGGEPKLILMGHDQYFRMEQILVDAQRYMGQEEYQVGVGSERTFPGTKTGLVLATYMGIPILPDADVPKSVGTSDVADGSMIYVLDTDYLELAVAQPTQYVENRDYFAANALVVRGLLYTMGELRCRNIWTQAKIMDRTATS